MRVVIAEDNVLLRSGIAELLAASDIDVVAQVGDADALIAAVDRTGPDAVLVDVRMPPDGRVAGLVAAREIRARHPDVGVLVLSQYVETSHALELIAERASGLGYLLKDRLLDPKELVEALRRVGTGGSAIDPTVVEQLVRRRGRDDDRLSALTTREREILASMAEGHSNQAIAGHLHLAEKTVEANIGRIFRKLGIADDATQNRRVVAVLSYLRERDSDLHSTST